MRDKDRTGKDKLYHFLICYGLSIASTEGAIGAALAKEYGDMKAAGNHWCWWDILADTTGIILGTASRLLAFGHWYWF